METTLTDFVRVLRNAEIRVSPAETLDAARALDIVGYADRERVHDVLAATLAKTLDEKHVFEDCFARFFAVRGADDGNGDGDTRNSAQAGPAEAADAAVPAGPGGIADELSELLAGNDPLRLQLAIDAAGRAAGIGNLRLFTQRGIYTRKVLEELGWQPLQERILTLEQAPPGVHPGHDEGVRLKQQADRLRDRVKDYVEEQYLLYASGNARELRESVLRTARLSHLEQRDLQQIRKLVRRIARRLAARYSRRKRSYRRGLLDVPRTLRKGSAHDGLLFEPVWKSVRKDRPVLIAVCDVSGSVRAYARFLLLFLYSLNAVLPRVRSFVFSSRLAEVTPLFDDNEPEIAIEIAQKRFGGGSTDYGAAIGALLEATGRDLDGGATVVMLGDGRNNRGDPALGAWREICQRARRVVWLNPESKSSWGTGDSEMLRYAPACSEARVVQSITQLERFADDLLRKGWS